jgi:hypothetical protein
MNMHKSFKTLGPLGCHGQNWSLMTRAKSIKFIVTCVPLWKAKKKYWPPNWTVSWNTKTITRPRSLGPRLCKWFFLHQRLCPCEEWTMLHSYQPPFCLRPLASWCSIWAKTEICPISCYLSSSCKWPSNNWLWKLEKLVSTTKSEICFLKTLDW